MITVQIVKPAWRRNLPKIVGWTRGVLHLIDELHNLTICYSSDNHIKQLNDSYRRKNKATNVLAFPGDAAYQGDIILAYETVRQEAAAQGKAFADHTAHLLLHAGLHLLGYDHQTSAEAAVMERQEIALLRKINISNPYNS